MSRAHDYLKQTIADALGDEAGAFWTEYRRLARLDNRDSEARLKRRDLRVSREKLIEWQHRSDEPIAATQIKRFTEQRDRAIAWLAKYGYSENE